MFRRRQRDVISAPDIFGIAEIGEAEVLRKTLTVKDVATGDSNIRQGYSQFLENSLIKTSTSQTINGSRLVRVYTAGERIEDEMNNPLYRAGRLRIVRVCQPKLGAIVLSRSVDPLGDYYPPKFEYRTSIQQKTFLPLLPDEAFSQISKFDQIFFGDGNMEVPGLTQGTQKLVNAMYKNVIDAAKGIAVDRSLLGPLDY